MSNETYLTVSYIITGAICLFLAGVAYLWLRRPVEEIANALPRKNWGKILARTFPLSMVLFAISACLSVNYYGGCNPIPFQKIVENRKYITTKNVEQVSRALDSIVMTVSLWGGILLLSLWAIRRERN